MGFPPPFFFPRSFPEMSSPWSEPVFHQVSSIRWGALFFQLAIQGVGRENVHTHDLELLLQSLSRHHFSEAATSSLNLCFSLFGYIRVYRSEGYSVAEIFFFSVLFLLLQVFTTQNKLY